jgi:hypothetical protein
MLAIMEMIFDRISEIFPEGCLLHLERIGSLMQYKEAQRRAQWARALTEAERIFTEGEVV